MVFDATNQLKHPDRYLGEFLRYRLKENADLIFEYSLKGKYKSNDESTTPS